MSIENHRKLSIDYYSKCGSNLGKVPIMLVLNKMQALRPSLKHKIFLDPTLTCSETLCWFIMSPRTIYIQFFSSVGNYHQNESQSQMERTGLCTINIDITTSTLPGKSHGQRSQVGCSPWECQESDTTVTSLPLFTFMHWRRKWHPTPVFLPGESQGRGGEGNGTPLQCSCLENPRDGGAQWAAVCGVTQSRTRLKRLSSSSSFQRQADLIQCCVLRKPQ